MKYKVLLINILLWVCAFPILTHAQTDVSYYDITPYYLQNAGFDTGYNYNKSATGNLNNVISEVSGWKNTTRVTYNSTAIIQLGSKKTFNGVSVPATGYDGTDKGGVLALSTGWNDTVRYVQTVKLPAGTYRLTAAWYNADASKTAGQSVLAFVGQYTKKYSALDSFPCLKWVGDTVVFTLRRTYQGDLMIGFAARNIKTPTNSEAYAKVACDFVKLERTTAYGKVDVVAVKEDLKKAITQATKLYGSGTGNEAAALQAAIDRANALYANDEAMREEVYASIDELSKAIEYYHYANPTGKVPTVTTGKRMARGATMAFGRMTLNSNGATVTERGFCYATHPNPTIGDMRSTQTMQQSGIIYVIDGLTPSTRYYMRPYAITSGYQVAYGEAKKFYTLPKGNINYSIREGDDNTGAKTRITAATKDAVNYWNNLTSIKGLNLSVGYASGTPTADCSYGGWIRVGSNSSYQRTGTLLHEMLHGVGVGTCGFWYDNDNFRERRDGSNRSSGHWLGDRANDVVRFLDNNDTEQLNGDYQHLWPFGINGANEDKGTAALYIANSLVCQALCEDGLPATSSINFAAPYYAFDQEDTIKYYLKNEDATYGRYTSFLKENADKTLKWTIMSTAEAELNDSVAWTITFNPKTCYYTFTNVATGDNIAYTSGVFKCKAKAVTTESRLQLIRGRMDVVSGSEVRGYSLVRPENTTSPHCLGASAGSAVSPLTFNYANSQHRLRWLILTAEESRALDAVAPPTSIKAVTTQNASEQPADIYNLSGQCVRRHAASTDGLPRGIYIFKGKKVVIK
jgi:hypothetical protein